MTIHLHQIPLFAAISTEIERQGAEQGTPRVLVSSQQLNAIISACNDIIAAMQTEDLLSKPGMGLANWLASDDTGASSRALAHHLCGVGLDPSRDRSAHPWDADDFGRCHRFFLAVPSAKKDLPKMAAVSPTWARLVEAWDTLTAFFEKQDREAFDELLKQVLKP